MTYTLSLLVAAVVVHVVSGSNPNVVKLANFAMDLHNNKSNSAYAYKVVDILSESAEMYPPAWVKYSIEAQVAETDCRNNEKVNLEDCGLRTNAQTMICKFVVLAVPGENTVPNHLLSDHCA